MIIQNVSWNLRRWTVKTEFWQNLLNVFFLKMIKLLIRCNDGIAAIGGSLMGNKLITFRPACCTDQTPIMSQNFKKVNKDKEKGMWHRSNPNHVTKFKK